MTATTETPASRAQLTALNAGLTEHGAKTRAHRIAIVAALVGCPNLTSTSELTRKQASSMLAFLDTLEQCGELVDLVEQYRPEVAS